MLLKKSSSHGSLSSLDGAKLKESKKLSTSISALDISSISSISDVSLSDVGFPTEIVGKLNGKSNGKPRETVGKPRETVGKPRETVGKPWARESDVDIVNFELTKASIQNISECFVQNSKDEDIACCLVNPDDPSTVDMPGKKIKSNVEEVRTSRLLRRRRRFSKM